MNGGQGGNLTIVNALQQTLFVHAEAGPTLKNINPGLYDSWLLSPNLNTITFCRLM